ncbi:MAG: hypothetical protein ACM3QS_00965 [Bacteroidota bacterium]
MKTRNKAGRFLALLAAASLLALPVRGVQAAPGDLSRVSVSSAGTQGNGDSFGAVLSGNGRYVAFASFANNLASGDTNADMDVFVRDAVNQTTQRVSVASDGSQINQRNSSPAISGDGRYVAFTSRPSPEGSQTHVMTPGARPMSVEFGGDILVHDRKSGQTLLVSTASNGARANGASYFAGISTSGRYISFVSDATNLVSGDTNDWSDVFVHDLQTGETKRVSLGSSGREGNDDSDHSDISGNGRFVAFDSYASNLVPGDTNGASDVFVHDRMSGQTRRISVNSRGMQANNGSYNPSISADGRYIAFWSLASNLASGDTNGQLDVFVHDLVSGMTRRISVASDGTQGNANSLYPSISGDGRYTTFESTASNLVSGDTNQASDIFLHDLQSGQTLRLSAAPDGGPANGDSYEAAISADGSRIAFDSYASNLISTDTNARRDVFLRENSVFKSAGALDGWVLESSEASGKGGKLDAGAATFVVGDDSADRQYRAILSFDTSALPDGAVITYAELRIRRAGLTGTDPFKTHGDLLGDIRKGSFSANAALQLSDFDAWANANAAIRITDNLVSGWYSGRVPAASLKLINKTGITQLRLRFARDDNDDRAADYLKFYSGNSTGAAVRPQLIVEFVMP